MTPSEKILQRAADLNITIWVENGNIKCCGRGAIPPKMVEVIRAHKTELIAHLKSLEDAMIAKEPVLCYACLNETEPVETHARFVGPEDLMYCERHYNALPNDWRKADLERYAEAMRQALPGWKVTVEPRCTLAEHIQRGSHQRQEETNPEDYWAETHARLTRIGYYEQVERDMERIAQRVTLPRVYREPFPAYELVEIGGVKTTRIIGMWHPTEDRLMTEEELAGGKVA